MKLLFTKAGMEHCAIVFGWANDPETRKNSFKTDFIPYDSHETWYSRKIVDPTCFFFIVSLNGELVGQVRLSVEGKVGEISYAVAKEHRNQGVGTCIICTIPRLLLVHSIPVTKLVGEVKIGNVASQKCFEHCEYAKEVKEDKINYHLGSTR